MFKTIFNECEDKIFVRKVNIDFNYDHRSLESLVNVYDDGTVRILIQALRVIQLKILTKVILINEIEFYNLN